MREKQPLFAMADLSEAVVQGRAVLVKEEIDFLNQSIRYTTSRLNEYETAFRTKDYSNLRILSIDLEFAILVCKAEIERKTAVLAMNEKNKERFFQ